MTYYANVNPDLFAFMPLDAARILELGCGAGALAAAYRERNPTAHYTAVEMHGPAADEAGARVDRLLIGDFEAMSDQEVCDGQRFDLIVLGDVLEHLFDAEGVLRRLKTMLTDDGRLALSVPNIGHWTALQHLMHGRWPQEDQGLFDRTHVRFFTLESLRKTLADTGFAPIRIRPRTFPLDKAGAERWIPRFADLAVAMGIDRKDFEGRCLTLQYVLVAKKAEQPATPPLHLAIAALAPLAMDVRTRLPAEYLQSMPEVQVHYRQQSLDLPQVAGDVPKLLVIQRPGRRDPEQWSTFLAGVLRQGWLVITEFDDHPDLAARVLGLDPNDPNRWVPFEHVHAIQTSTQPLAEAFRAHNPEIGIFPNAAFVRPPFAATRDGPPTVFYGALNRGAFAVRLAESLAPAIAAVPDLTFEVVHDRAFFDALPTANKRFQPLVPYDRYGALLRQSSIALLPLEGTADELFKSDLKFVESAAAGVAVITSPAVYANTVRDGETGLIAPTIADWAPALIRLANDPAERARIAKAAWDEVGAGRMFADQIPARLAWYRDLWARRDELNAALIARVPTLAEKLGR